jgi:hypothetical protein
VARLPERLALLMPVLALRPEAPLQVEQPPEAQRRVGLQQAAPPPPQAEQPQLMLRLRQSRPRTSPVRAPR